MDIDKQICTPEKAIANGQNRDLDAVKTSKKVLEQLEKAFANYEVKK